MECGNPKSLSGSFLLQSLLALALVIAFLPMLTNIISRRGADSELAATAAQLSGAATAASAFMASGAADDLPFGATTMKGEKFADALEPYGLPIGFVPTTPFGGAVSLVVLRNAQETDVFVVADAKKMSEIARSDLALRIGFWAAQDIDGKLCGATAGWEIDPSGFNYKPADNAIYVRATESVESAELVSRNPRRASDNKFNTDLNMGKNDIVSAGKISGRMGQFDAATVSELTLLGTENGRDERNTFTKLNIGNAKFGGLNISRGTLSPSSVSAASIGKYGDLSNITSDDMQLDNLQMAAGGGYFNGPPKWTIDGGAFLQNTSLSADIVTLSGFLDAAGGQSSYVDSDGYVYIGQSGITTDTISAANITLRDQTSAAMVAGTLGPVMVDVRVGGTSILPDVDVAGINNDTLQIIADAAADTDKTESCKNIIGKYAESGTRYDKNSVAQNIVCQYVLWQRLEQRINIKQCLLNGDTDCKK